jgi:hypothetical protein
VSIDASPRRTRNSLRQARRVRGISERALIAIAQAGEPPSPPKAMAREEDDHIRVNVMGPRRGKAAHAGEASQMS